MKVSPLSFAKLASSWQGLYICFTDMKHEITDTWKYKMDLVFSNNVLTIVRSGFEQGLNLDAVNPQFQYNRWKDLITLDIIITEKTASQVSVKLHFRAEEMTFPFKILLRMAYCSVSDWELIYHQTASLSQAWTVNKPSQWFITMLHRW